MNERKLLPGMDVLKFIMALLVVAIHSEAVNEYKTIYKFIYPLLETAVPLFFVISAFFVFRKLRSTDNKNSNSTILHFTKRLLILYGFWFIIQLPLVIYTRHYLQYDLTILPFILIKDLILCSTFHGSWFLSALIVGVWIIYLLQKKLDDKYIWILPLCISIYAYHPEFTPPSWQKLWFWYQTEVQTPLNSFPVALIWIVIGYILSSQKKQDYLKTIKGKYLIFTFILSWLLSSSFSIDLRLFMVMSLFIIGLKWNKDYKPIFKYMRQSSILIFILHFIFISAFRHFMPQFEILQHGLTLYFLLVVLCLISSSVILKLKSYKLFYWLKYAY